ncbi:hypothetical protein VTN77DRAFT_8184 [Rasamsonia byssochlamydoides]|uniref:uncharacterized protein n=1 Tax=Rasamsonia byssochlamydoides TaxID=89139 RepID=UPI0037434624
MDVDQRREDVKRRLEKKKRGIDILNFVVTGDIDVIDEQDLDQLGEDREQRQRERLIVSMSDPQRAPPPYEPETRQQQQSNVWPILLKFSNGAIFEGTVLLDSGSWDNWISLDVVRREKIPWEDDPDREVAVDFNGRTVQSCGLVKAWWTYRHQMFSVTFRVAIHTPEDTVLGFRYLIQRGILTLHPDIKSSKGAYALARHPKTGKKSGTVGTILNL